MTLPDWLHLADWLILSLLPFLLSFLLFIHLFHQLTSVQHLQLFTLCAGAGNIPVSKVDKVPTFEKLMVSEVEAH